MAKQILALTVNGEHYEVAVDPRDTLLRVIRDQLDLTGTKEGCGEGECGACTVLLDGKPVCSCIMLGLDAEGCEITTIEGVAQDGKLHALQEAFVEHGAIQCGFCTSGMILSARALLDTNPDPSDEDIRRSIVGNLCRCTGYTHIVTAIRAAADAMNGE
jgi:carbon-monoxide dehydrogenase small subunit